ncbi:MAG: PLP-dependent lyase/thiolase, partial [Planctomycetota bacterium]
LPPLLPPRPRPRPRRADYAEIVEGLDDALAATCGRGFRVTPLARGASLNAPLGMDPSATIWIKDETGNAGGSHKARHLMEVLIHLEVIERLGWTETRGERTPPLAVASCGNAALAAALLARAAGRPLDVYIPDDAEAPILREIRDLGARIHVCHREAECVGDPCMMRFRRAVAEGAIPFSCQGSENGLVIDGGKTLGLELITQLRENGELCGHLFLQVGGGALASSVMRAFREWTEAPRNPIAPRFHAVQTRSVHPLRLAHDRLEERILEAGGDTALTAELRHAACHRSEFMRPWKGRLESVARGILDDETYDWRAVLEGLFTSGGLPIVVDDETILEAHSLAREETGIDVSATGSAGLAGLIHLLREEPSIRGESVAVIFTGVER